MSINKDKLYVEQRDQGDYAVRRGGSQRVSDVLPTQREAIERARELNPGHSPVVERVRHTNVGKPDQWAEGLGSVDLSVPGMAGL
jgi:Uncharacterized protein conserved in bacteria (DUF2188)